MAKKITEDEMMTKCLEKHGDLYEYDFSEFRKNKKIIINCKIHGKFKQNYYDHLKGCGCPKCSKVGKLTTREFIEKSIKKHGLMYEYSKVEYEKYETDVCIICKIHGEFKQTPHSHLRGRGCPFCGKDKTRKSNFKTNGEFLNKAKEAHGEKYEYLEEYKNQKTKIKILCKKHGEFFQTPKYHL